VWTAHQQNEAYQWVYTSIYFDLSQVKSAHVWLTSRVSLLKQPILYSFHRAQNQRGT